MGSFCLTRQVPLLPFIPVISMFVNVYLMMQLDRGTWIRFAIWMGLGEQPVFSLAPSASLLLWCLRCFPAAL